MPRSTPEPTLVTPEVLRAWQLPEPTGGKNARGSVLVIGGSTETLGAVLLAAEAALRAGAGIREQYPDEAGRRDLLGKFYYRPPGGESWADVALRIRSLLATEGLRHDCERLLIVAHQAVIMVFRYVLEELTEQELLAVDKEEQVANASLTRYERTDDGGFRLIAFNEVEHIVAEAEDVTKEPDAAQSP